jgi:hypothetical protein
LDRKECWVQEQRKLSSGGSALSSPPSLLLTSPSYPHFLFSTLYHRDPPILLIDGYNMIGYSDEMARLRDEGAAAGSLEAARNRLQVRF